MSFTKVIKASKPQQSISSFVACCHEKSFQPQNTPNSISNDLNQNSLNNARKQKLKKQSFWQNDTPSTFIHRFLLQNISSLNSLSNSQKHDYAEFQGDEFIHVLQIEEQEVNSGINETETIMSQFIESTKVSLETISDAESVFQFQFQKEQITQN